MTRSRLGATLGNLSGALTRTALYVAVLLVTALASLPVRVAEPPEPSYPEQLIALHGCWTYGEPAGATVSGHVVATRPGDPVTPVYGGRWLAGLALEQVAYDQPQLGWSPAVDHGIVVYAFCP